MPVWTLHHRLSLSPVGSRMFGAVTAGRVSDRVVGGMVVGCDRLLARVLISERHDAKQPCAFALVVRIAMKHLRPLHHHASICCLLVWVVMEGRKENKQKKWFDENQSLGSSVLVALLGIRRAAFVCTPAFARSKDFNAIIAQRCNDESLPTKVLILRTQGADLFKFVL